MGNVGGLIFLVVVPEGLRTPVTASSEKAVINRGSIKSAH